LLPPFRVAFCLTGYWELAAAELLSLGNDSPNGLIRHSGNMHDLLLALELLGCSGWLLGQEGGGLVALTLILISSLLVVLTLLLLLLLRKLPLVLLLLALTLMLVLVTLLELLRWVA
jgi:hypothetical protein